MLVVQSILLCYGIDLLEYLKSIIDRYIRNGGTSDSEVNKIIIMSIKIIIFIIFLADY